MKGAAHCPEEGHEKGCVSLCCRSCRCVSDAAVCDGIAKTKQGNTLDSESQRSLHLQQNSVQFGKMLHTEHCWSRGPQCEIWESKGAKGTIEASHTHSRTHTTTELSMEGRKIVQPWLHAMAPGGRLKARGYCSPYFVQCLSCGAALKWSCINGAPWLTL